MKRILITGATGNVGLPVLDELKYSDDLEVLVGVRDPGNKVIGKPVTPVFFDFEMLEDSIEALKNLDCLFLLRPSNISDVNKHFEPLISKCRELQVRHIVFLSVQGVDKSSILPHYKIEQLIKKSGLPFTFIRPAYFMQNLSGTLKRDIIKKDRIYIPTGKAKFNWIDAEDVAKAIAKVLSNPDDHINKKYIITGSENLTFDEVATQMSSVLSRKISYTSPNLVKFFIKKKKEGMKPASILMMIMLHFLQRFEMEPEIHYDFQLLTGDEPRKLRAFLNIYREEWLRK